MAEDGKIIYKILADDTGFADKAKHAGDKGGSFLKEAMTGAARAIGEAFVSMAGQAISGIEQIVKSGIDFNSKMEKYTTAFTTLTGSAEEAARIMSQIRQDAAATPFDVDSLTQANQLLVSAGVDADSARKDVLNLANAIAATGGGSAELSRMAQNMQQIKNVGKATAADIKQFANAGINIYKILADAQGISVEKASELEVTYEMLADAMAKAAEEGGAYEGALEAQSQTFEGRMSTLKDNWAQLTGVLTEDLFNRLSSQGLPQVMDYVQTILTAAQEGGISGAVSAAGQIISSLTSTIVSKAPELVKTGLGALTDFIKGITNNVGKATDTAKELIVSILETIGECLPDLLQAGVDLVIAIGEGLISAIPDLLAAAGSLLSQLWDTLTGLDFRGVGTRIVEGIRGGISSAWGSLKDYFKGLLSGLGSGAIADVTGGATTGGGTTGITPESAMADVLGNQDSSVYALDAAPSDNFISDPAAFMSGVESGVSSNINATGTQEGLVITVPLFIDSTEVARATAYAMGEQLAWEEMGYV